MNTNSGLIKPILLFIFSFLLLSCSTDENEDDLLPFSTDPCELVTPTPEGLRFEGIYDPPIITLEEDHIFYSNERMDIEWSLPGDLWNTEIQFIETSQPFSCDDYYKFHELKNDGFGYGYQYVHYYSSPQSLSYQDTIFVSYRARSTDVNMVKNYSLWTNIKSFIIVPAGDLNKKTVSEIYNLSFITEEQDHHYYSGVTSFPNYRLSDIADANEIPFEKIKVVNLVGFQVTFKTFREDGSNPFSSIIIGYDDKINPQSTFYPFDVLGVAYPGSFEESPMPGNIQKLGNLEQNIISDVMNYDLKVAYHLEEIAGSQQEIELNLIFDIYYED
ncbi:hypothetical protein [Salinimicrobium sediminilitoris]|uniref:hypothetical protein n=1 Tax=Salinimicrobium sediminilitoris TaxID=2876715 RepID=UPI001E334F38|nr:hypothetical protein [Salinimicrobium sediminilitoris]MCC8361114.1 hypothetical protein [Salinimicrobium sediminilitoris]